MVRPESDPQGGDEAFLLIDHHIDGDTDQDLGRDIKQLVDDGAHGGLDNGPAISARVANQPVKCRLPSRRSATLSDTPAKIHARRSHWPSIVVREERAG